MIKNLSIILAVAISLPAATHPFGNANIPQQNRLEEIIVFPAVVENRNGFEDIQEMFGVMFSSGDSPEVRSALQDVNVNHYRNILKHGSPPRGALPPWLTYKAARGHRRYNPWDLEKDFFRTAEEAKAWFAEWVEQDPVAFWNNALQNAPFHDYGASMTMSVSPWAFDGRFAWHLDRVGLHFSAYAHALYSKLPPDRKHIFRFLQFVNEPTQIQFGSVGNGDDNLFRTLDEKVTAYLAIFNEAYKAIKSEYSDLRVIGPCIQSYGIHDLVPGGRTDEDTRRAAFGYWDDWAKRFVEGVEDPEALSYFNYQAYSSSAYLSLAHIAMLQAYSQNLRSIRPRAVITETGTIAGREDKINTTNTAAMEMFVMSNYPDKFAVRTQYTAVGGAPGLINLQNREKNPIYWIYWAMQNARGKRLYSINEHPDILSLATSPTAGKTTVCLFNPKDSPKEFTFSLNLDEDDVIHRVHLRRVSYNAKFQAEQHEGDIQPARQYTVQMPPHSVYTYEFETNISPAMKVSVHTHYGRDTNMDVNGTVASTVIEVPYLPGENDRVDLQFALYTPPFEQLQQTGLITVRFNGEEYSIPRQDLPKHNMQLPSHKGDRAFVTIPVPGDKVRLMNTVDYPREENVRLMYTSLVYTGDRDRRTTIAGGE